MSQAFEVIQPSNSTTLIEFLLDETGSMGHVRQATIGSFNEYINSQKAQDGTCLLTLTKFDDRGIRTQYEDANIQTVEYLTEETYAPRGMTNLYDAIGTRIAALDHRLHQFPDAAKLMVIMTDGADNMSKEFNPDSLKTLIKQREEKGWTFVFLGANQDAWKVGQTFGMSQGNTMTYQASDVKGAMAAVTNATAAYRSVRSQGLVGSAESAQNFFGALNANEKK